MSSRKQTVAAKTAEQPMLRKNPELAAELDRFIKGNPKLFSYYLGLSKDALIQKVMLGLMQRCKSNNRCAAVLKTWLEEHPEIIAKVEERIRNLRAANRARASLNAEGEQ